VSVVEAEGNEEFIVNSPAVPVDSVVLVIVTLCGVLELAAPVELATPVAFPAELPENGA
jgi:hypothetical protein